MIYWIWKWIINPNGTQRISVQNENPLVESLLIDSIYIEDLKMNDFITEYFFKCPNDNEFTEKEIRNYWLEFMAREWAITYIRENTNLVEQEVEWNFLIRPADELNPQAIYLTI